MSEETLAERLQKVYGGLIRYAYKLQDEWGYYEPAEARDLVQETCLKVIKKPNSYRADGGATFYSYAVRILINTFNDRGEKKQFMDEYKKSLKAARDVSMDSDGNFRSSDIIDQISADKSYTDCIKALTEKQYKVFLAQMSTSEDKKPRKNKDLSKLLGIPLGTLEPLLVRAKVSFGNCIRDKMKISQEAST